MESVQIVKHIVEAGGYYEPKKGAVEHCIKYIDTKYPMNKENVLKAFELAIDNQLDVELKTTMSVKEIARVMHIYDNVFKKHKQEVKDEVVSEEEKRKRMSEMIDNIEGEFQNYCQGKEARIYVPCYIHDWLIEIGCMDALTQTEERVVKQAEQRMRTEVVGSDVLNVFEKKHMLKNIDKDGGLKAMCKKIALFEYFKELAAAGKSLKAEILTKYK